MHASLHEDQVEHQACIMSQRNVTKLAIKPSFCGGGLAEMLPPVTFVLARCNCSLEPGPTLVDMVTTGFGPGGQ